MSADALPADAEVAAALCSSIDRFAARSIDARSIDASARIPDAVLSGLAALGVFGATLPVAWGGSGLDLADAAVIIETLARHDRSVATTVGLHLGLGTRALVEHGSVEQKAAYLPRLATGEMVAAFATTEPSAGSDLSAIATTLTPRDDGLSLSGQKAYITNGAIASLLTVAAKIQGQGSERGTSLVLVEASDPGVHRLQEEKKLGLRGSSTTGFVFEDVRLPSGRLLGAPGSGPGQLAEVLAWGRLLMSAGCVGTAQAALDRALEHTNARSQFGKRLDEQPVVRMMLGAMRARVFAMRSLVRQAARALCGAELARASTVAKVFCSESAWKICDMALQLHGGSGYIEGTGVSLLLRDARVTRIFEGSNEVLLTHLGMIELSQPRARDAVATLTGSLPHIVAQHSAELQDRLGVRAVQDKLALYRLGGAVVLRDAVAAAYVSAEATGSEEALSAWRTFSRAALAEATLHLEQT